MATPNRVGVVIFEDDGKWFASLIHGCGYVARPLWLHGLPSRRAVIAALDDAMPSN